MINLKVKTYDGLNFYEIGPMTVEVLTCYKHIAYA